MSFQAATPEGYTGKGDEQLIEIHRKLKRLLGKALKSIADEALNLPPAARDQIAGVLVEFAEDLHNDIGIWRSYEQYNREFFGTPLPLILLPGEEIDGKDLLVHRVHHLLWNLYPEFDPDLILSPTYDPLYLLSEQIADCLEKQFEKMPKDSGVRKFLHEPNAYGWDVKRKLVWLGTRSYLFRFLFGNYLEINDAAPDIPIIDDFICEETTTWSGLGAIDILAGVLDISDAQRRELRSWYERYLAMYRVTASDMDAGTLTVRNLLNEKLSVVNVGEDMVKTLSSKKYILGNLVMWNGEWYWSGEQHGYAKLTKKQVQQFKDDFMISMPNVVYRSCDDLAKKARDIVQMHYDEFVKYHGSDLILYSDAHTLINDLQKQIRVMNEETSLVQGAFETLVENSDAFDEMVNGIAVYFNPDEGQEMMEDFNEVISALNKKGVDLTDDEEDSLRALIFNGVISPNFVHRIVREYGSQSLAAAFFIDDTRNDLFLDYLLRKYKGHFYRKRYPTISLM